MALSNLSTQKPSGDPRGNLVAFTKCSNRMQPLVAGASLEIVPANPNRLYLIVINFTEGDVFLFLDEPKALLDQGIPLLGKGNHYEITEDNLFRGNIVAICKDAARLSISECSL